jgi:hypothetical protein
LCRSTFNSATFDSTKVAYIIVRIVSPAVRH